MAEAVRDSSSEPLGHLEHLEHVGHLKPLAACVMVLGTSSGAGKSWLATALCRFYANQGLRVAPFKAQNMSNNARLVPTPEGDLGEMGSAQYFQSLAARAVPHVGMNPLLLKPEADTRSQVVLMGQVDRALSETPWRERSNKVWPRLATALHQLRQTCDVVVIEGAGSPAEINLMANDVVNLRVAREADAACLLVTDIDRGGAFAHLYGTWALLPPEDKTRIKGFVLNKFRGDEALLAPAPEQLEQLTGVPTLATLPMVWAHGLPEEDGLLHPLAPQALAAQGQGGSQHGAAPAAVTVVAVLAYPHISNLDEFQPLRHLSHVRLVWARTPADLAQAQWVVLPGSKSTVADLAWLRQQGLDAAIAHHAAQGRPVLGICGGLQMLGEAVGDPDGVEARDGEGLTGGNAPGLGLLPLVTRFAARKTLRHTQAQFAVLPQGPWQGLSGGVVQGYEIHHGVTQPHPAMVAAGQGCSPAWVKANAADSVPETGWVNAAGHVLGLYLHGLFENPQVLQALFGPHAQYSLDTAFDQLADCAQQRFGQAALMGLLTPPTTPS